MEQEHSASDGTDRGEQTPGPPPREAVMALIDLLNHRRLEEAIAHGERLASNFAPSLPLYNMLGSANIEAGRRAEATNWFRNALGLDPNHVETLYNMGITCQELGRKTEAIYCFERILRIRPDMSRIRALKLLLQAHICDWSALAQEARALGTLGIEGAIVSPFTLLPLEDRPDRHRLRSERYSKELFKQAPLPPPPRPATSPKRLRIGYFSAELRNHPVARLIARVLELHDRSRFEICVYSYGPVVEDETRTRIVASADRFRDMSQRSEEEIANVARRDGIDIAVDLTGHTSYARTGLFACRPAPIQISYLGYPGTSGASFIDYVIADKLLIPRGHERFYSEAPIYLPHCYQAQDDTALAAERPSRAMLGLPDDSFVFCGINNSYKITPDLFDVWMRLLRRMDGSVLWLLKSNPWAEANLRQQAEARGLDPGRILFAEWKSYEEYLAQFAAADLFLDSFHYNAGATASNALWAGLPLITKPGLGYPARMAASLLTAVGLPELITSSVSHYEALAIELATNREKLAAIRGKLEKNRRTTALFDSALFTRHLEQAYLLSHRRWIEGLPVAPIDVPDLSESSPA